MPRQDTSGRAYDLVLYGATGFTGALTAAYLASHVPKGCRWALAGRSTAKLEQLRDRLAQSDPSCAELPLLRADSGDPGSLRELAMRHPGTGDDRRSVSGPWRAAGGGLRRGGHRLCRSVR